MTRTVARLEDLTPDQRRIIEALWAASDTPDLTNSSARRVSVAARGASAVPVTSGEAEPAGGNGDARPTD